MFDRKTADTDRNFWIVAVKKKTCQLSPTHKGTEK